MMIKSAIQKLILKENLKEQEIMEVIRCIMEGNATQSQIAGFLTALKFKGETVEEITGCVKVMREKAEKVKHNLNYCIDTCGTGGDGANTFNISTTASLVAAAAGAKIAKHGNRAMTSNSGSADVLEAMGVNITINPEQVGRCIEEVGIGFMFAQLYHKSMQYAAGVRKELGIKTVFNILGPLTNPANAKGQIIGVFDESLTTVIAEVLQRLGTERALIVHGFDGLDEITITAPTKISELKDGIISEYVIDALDFGIPRAKHRDITGGNAAYNADILKSILEGEKGARRNIVLINAAASLYVAKVAKNLKEGIAAATEIIDTGRAALKLDELREYTLGQNRMEGATT